MDDGDNVFDCSLSGSSFGCPDRQTQEEDAAPLDAVVTVHVSIAGSFSSGTQVSGHQTANVTCAGPDCATVATAVGLSGFPCSLSQSFTASHQGP